MKVEPALVCPQLCRFPHLGSDPVRKWAQRRVGEGRGRPVGFGLQFLAGRLQSAQIGPILLPTMTPFEFSGGGQRRVNLTGGGRLTQDGDPGGEFLHAGEELVAGVGAFVGPRRQRRCDGREFP